MGGSWEVGRLENWEDEIDAGAGVTDVWKEKKGSQVFGLLDNRADIEGRVLNMAWIVSGPRPWPPSLVIPHQTDEPPPRMMLADSAQSTCDLPPHPHHTHAGPSQRSSR